MIGLPQTLLSTPGHDDAQTHHGRVRVWMSHLVRPPVCGAGPAASACHPPPSSFPRCGRSNSRSPPIRNASCSSGSRTRPRGTISRSAGRTGPRTTTTARSFSANPSRSLRRGSACTAHGGRDPERRARPDDRACVRDAATAFSGSPGGSHSTAHRHRPRRLRRTSQDLVLLARASRRLVVHDVNGSACIRPGRLPHQPRRRRTRAVLRAAGNPAAPDAGCLPGRIRFASAIRGVEHAARRPEAVRHPKNTTLFLSIAKCWTMGERGRSAEPGRVRHRRLFNRAAQAETLGAVGSGPGLS